MRIVSWNVNGIRACAKNGFADWLAGCKAQIVGLQEVRALPEQIPEEVREPKRWHVNFSAAERKGYSGVGLYSRKAPDEVITSIGRKEFDIEGRVQIARYGKLTLANVYFPNGSGKDRDNSRIPYKLKFYKRLFKLLDDERKSGGRVLVMGDYNTAHQAIDLARPKSNEKTSGFCIEEREELDRLLKLGWVDTFREFNTKPDNYSWWSRRAGARERNVGWRIDYIFASPGAMKFVKKANIHPDVMGSDHCPISVDVSNDILG